MTELILPIVAGVGCATGVLLSIAALRGVSWNLGEQHFVRWVGARARVVSPVRIILAIAAGLLALVLTGWIVGGVIAVFAAWFLPSVLRGGATAKARIARTEAIAGWAEMIRDTLAGAAGLEEAIIATAPIAPLAIRSEVSGFATRLRHAPLSESLARLGDELADPTGDLVVSALRLAATRHARDLRGLLGSLASSARAQAAMQQRVEAGRARTRSAVRMVTAFTALFVVGMVVLNRDYLAPFDSVIGQCVLAAVGGGFAVAFLCLDRMARAGEIPRVLVNRSPA